MNKNTILSTIILTAGLQLGFAEVKAPDEPMSIWFTKPARTYLESGPIGNGRLGAMDLGGIEEQRVVLNESSMWSGGPYQSNRDGAWKSLPEIQARLFKGDISGAESILKQNFRYPDGVKGWFDENQFGCYQILSDLFIRHEYQPKNDPFSITSPSGHAEGDGKTIKNATDGSIGSKWCVPNAGKRVHWQVALPEKKSIQTYSLTSAEDFTRSRPPRMDTGRFDG